MVNSKSAAKGEKHEMHQSVVTTQLYSTAVFVLLTPRGKLTQQVLFKKGKGTKGGEIRGEKMEMKERSKHEKVRTLESSDLQEQPVS